MKRTLSTWFCLLSIACADTGDDDQGQLVSNATAAPLPFESNTVLELVPLDSAACYTGSNALVPGFSVYQDARSFQDAYLAARPKAAQVPAVDFASYVVVGAVLGQQGGCGAKLQLVSATNFSDDVEVQLRSSSGDCDVPSDRVSYAFAFARVNRLDKPYQPVDISEPASCPSSVFTP
ncbi:MAG TPA: hypothetical protein VI299_19725 [Polyangiales bacterium]